MKHLITAETPVEMVPGNKDHWSALLANANNKHAITGVSNENKLTRVEVIDWKNGGGRLLTFWEEDAKIWIDLQDEGRTLKVFIEQK